MTLTTLLLYITAAALGLTALTHFALKSTRSLGMSFLQNWAGALFVFSGYVKAVDPLGTAYKMEQYFAEFESTFADTALSFAAPLFPAMSEWSVGFSVFMIVLEIALGAALIVGFKPKLSSWLFFGIVAFFTVLTGFTYLTGYVPFGVNFFDFAGWGPYETTNMKVTDCGCFGDFLKLEPRTSFFKDIFLLFPALAFLLGTKKMHQVGTPTLRTFAVSAVAAFFLVMSLGNYVWDIPKQDFRPFKVGTDVAAVQRAELEAAENVTVTGYKLTSKENGEVVRFTMNDFLAKYKDYPEETWEIEQETSEPEVAPTKISDFEVSDVNGENIVPALLSDPGYTFVIVAYKLKGEVGDWNEDYLAKWTEDIQPVTTQALAAGHKVMAMTSFNDAATLDDFRAAIGADYPFHTGDDIMLKTIIRSNPGVVLFKDGVIVNKWHHRRLPDYEAIAADDILASANK